MCMLSLYYYDPEFSHADHVISSRHENVLKSANFTQGTVLLGPQETALVLNMFAIVVKGIANRHKALAQTAFKEDE